ncbi:MAG: Flp pilus assembly protein CpaB [Comamonadaceae bacterium]|nr:MAG: Flp pilus assembly protein CpaB [Comamonadaceae bacterium]
MIHLSKIIAAVLVLMAVVLGAYAWVLARRPAPVQVATAPQAASRIAVESNLFPVVVTSKAATAGQPIPPDALRIEMLPIDPPGSFKTIEAAAARIPVSDLGPATPLLESQLASGLALRLAEGERALAIRVDEVMGVANRVRPGDLVDVFFSLKADGREVERSQVRLLLARKRVLAFGHASVDGIPSADAQSAASQQQRAEAPRTAVLAIPVEEVAALAVAETNGRLILALRHPGDAAVPVPGLLADLPPAVAPVGARGGPSTVRAGLGAVDQAQAGLSLPDLALGGGDAQGRRPARPLPVAASLPLASPPGRAAIRVPTSTARSDAAGLAPASTRANEVEIFRGDKRESITY